MFKHLTPVSGDIFYRRNDPYDVRLGDVAYRNRDKYDEANVVVLGCPQDIGVVRNKGRAGAAGGPDAIRKELYKYPVSKDHEYLKLVDLGNIDVRGELEDIHSRLYDVVSRILKDGKKIVILGGGNDISYPDCCAMAGVSEKTLVFNIDRHLDVRADKERNSGTPYRQLLEECIEPDRFYEVGINTFANSQGYIDYVEGKGANIYLLGEIREKGVRKTLEQVVKNSDSDAIFWGFDMDVVRAAEAPGVSSPGPMGFTAVEVCEVADVAAMDPRTRIIEITEVNPRYDINDLTSKLAANVIMRALANLSD